MCCSSERRQIIGGALKHVWVFILAPFVGAVLSAVVWGAIAPAATAYRTEKAYTQLLR